MANTVGIRRDSFSGVAPVGSFPANPFGLYDVHGNVSEWVEDCHNGSYEGAPSDGSAWTTGICFARVLRGSDGGGQWYDLRAASRNWSHTDDRHFYNGFRVARTLTP